MIRQFMSREFLLFVMTGGTAAAVNFASRMVYNRWMEFSSAIVLAYVTGMVVAFILARQFVFKDGSQSIHRSVVFFTLVNIVGVLQTWAISMLLAYYVLPVIGVTSFVREIAHGVGLAVPAFTSYLGHKRWSFRSRP